MAQQFLGAKQALAVRTLGQGVPTADGDGTALSQFNGSVPGPADRPKRFLIRVDVLTNTGTSVNLTLQTKDRVITGGTGAWGTPVDPSGNLAALGNGTALPVGKTYWFIFEDVGCFTEVCLYHTADTGALANISGTLLPRTGNTLTKVGHGMTNGDGPYVVSNSGGALPGGLTAGTQYWIIVIDADTFQFATSKANALAATPVVLSSDGTGTQTIDRHPIVVAEIAPLIEVPGGV